MILWCKDNIIHNKVYEKKKKNAKKYCAIDCTKNIRDETSLD